METVFVVYCKDGKFHTQERIKKNFLNERTCFEKTYGLSVMINPTFPCEKLLKPLKKLLLELHTKNDFLKVLKFLDLREKYEN